MLRALLAVALGAAACAGAAYWLLADGGEAAHGVGHRRRFGTSRFDPLPVPSLAGFAPPRRFFKEFVRPLRPLLMRGAVKDTRAFRLWEDEYFLSLRLDPEASKVHVETTKKERRDQRTYDAPFQHFVRSYNSSGHYMVASMPAFLAEDFPLPWPLQCPGAEAALVEAIVWFSSGGTSSVVHTDAVDNVNCLLRGNKTFVLVDPALYGDRVPIDRPEGAYSSIDVDSVDFRAYPGIADVQYYIVHMLPGDCLYIPYKWIHQVRSYGRNIAVNVWFDKSLVLGADNCSESMRHDWLLDAAKFKGFEYRPPAQLLQEMLDREGKPLTFDTVLRNLVPDHKDWRQRFGDTFADHLMLVFSALDADRSSAIEQSELKDLPAQKLREIDASFLAFDKEMKRIFEVVDREKEEL